MRDSSKLVIATRGSMLALWQADYVASLLAANGIETEKLIIKTTGDRVQDRFLHEIGGKGLFTREIEHALQDKSADLAVHSLKDMPARIAPDFTLPAILKRHACDDLLIFRDDFHPEAKLPEIAGRDFLRQFGSMVIGTGSLRRKSILERQAPEAKIVGIRGNVDTRIRKLQAGEWDAIILAHASIERLAISGIRKVRLGTDWFIPSPSQGALAIECRAGDPVAEKIRQILNCDVTERCVTVERTVLALLGGDCTMPFSCILIPGSHETLAHAAVYGKNGTMAEAKLMTTHPVENPRKVADELFRQLINNGARDVLATIGLSIP